MNQDTFLSSDLEILTTGGSNQKIGDDSIKIELLDRGINSQFVEMCVLMIINELPALRSVMGAYSDTFLQEQEVEQMLRAQRLSDRILRQNGTTALITLDGRSQIIPLQVQAIISLLSEYDWCLIRQLFLGCDSLVEGSGSISAQLVRLVNQDNFPLGLHPDNLARFIDIPIRVRGELRTSDLALLYDDPDAQAGFLDGVKKRGTRGLNTPQRVASALIGKIVHNYLRYGLYNHGLAELLGRFSDAVKELDSFLCMYLDEVPPISLLSSLVCKENEGIYNAYSFVADILAVLVGERLGVLKDKDNTTRSFVRKVDDLIETNLNLSLRGLVDSFTVDQLDVIKNAVEGITQEEILAEIARYIEASYGEVILRLFACFLSLQRISQMGGLFADIPEDPAFEVSLLLGDSRAAGDGRRADVIFFCPDRAARLIEIKTYFGGTYPKYDHKRQLQELKQRLLARGDIQKVIARLVYVGPFGIRVFDENGLRVDGVEA